MLPTGSPIGDKIPKGKPRMGKRQKLSGMDNFRFYWPIGVGEGCRARMHGSSKRIENENYLGKQVSLYVILQGKAY